jgi:ADP-heptose:LPS heptosyltransferase
MKRIVVTRFSAMGDVAMVASVLKELQNQHNDTEIIMVSRKLFAGFFDGIPRLRFHEFDPNVRHKGLSGLYRLFKELTAYRPTAIADLHNNLRSRVLDSLFILKGYSIQAQDKGRIEKWSLVQHRIFRPLKQTTERYADVFRKLGFSLSLRHELNHEDRPVPIELQQIFEQSDKTIGIAPFAQHPYKVWPLHKMEDTIRVLVKNNYSVFIFGGGNHEKEIAEAWSRNHTGVYNTIGKYNIRKELDIIANLDLLLSMDSSGMHMASLVGTRCLSIWGATHPFAGFLGYGQSMADCIQVEHPNRPSSIYGNKPCDCDGIEAIDLVTSEMVIRKLAL